MTNSKKHPLIEWSKEQPKWQQDALRLLVKFGYADSISEKDQNQLKKILFSEANGTNTNFSPIVESDVPETDVDEPKTYLKSLGPVENIDKLASNQYPFEFVSPNGMTVIYGNNGSGKSGYARILKRLCHSQQGKKSAFTIRGDVTANKNDDWTVDFLYAEKVNYSEEQIIPHKWKKSDENKEFYSLKRIAFFDSDVANIYVDGDRELLYFPSEIRLYTELGIIADNFTALIKAKIKEVKKLLPFLPNTTKGSKIHKILLKLDIDNVHTLSKEDIHSVCLLNDKEQIELKMLNARKLQSPKQQKTVLEDAKKILIQLNNDIYSSSMALNKDSLEKLLNKFIIYYQLKLNAEKSLSDLAKSMPINNGIGSDVWFEMFNAARQFATQIYPDGESPEISTGKYCVLCHRTLNLKAKERLKEFDVFMDDTLQNAVNDAKNHLDEHQNIIIRLPTLNSDVIKQQLQLFANLSAENEKQVLSIINDISIISILKKKVVSVLKSNNFKELSSLFIPNFNLKSNLKTVVSVINLEIERLDTLIGSEVDGLSVLELESLIELEDKIKCREQKNNLELRFKLLNQMKNLNVCLTKIDTKPITIQCSLRIRQLISDDLKARYKTEIEWLKLNYLKISVGSKGQKGKPKIECKIENLEKIKKSEILSEGEQRAVALAGFLTEVNETKKGHAIILDDPVSSLDWDRRGLIASRLAEEAKKRQVIIFTHDFSFALQLEKLCDDKNQLVTDQYFKQCWIGNQYVGPNLQFGLIGENMAAWESKKVFQRIQTIEKKIFELKEKNIFSDGSGTSEYDTKATQIVKQLRQTWERAVEQLIFNDTVQRLSPEVNTKKLRLVKFDCDLDYKAIYEGMSAISAPLHDNPSHGGSASPTIAEMESNFALLNTWVDGLISKQKKLEAVQKEIKTKQMKLKTGGDK